MPAPSNATTRTASTWWTFGRAVLSMLLPTDTTLGILTAMTNAIQADLTYNPRDEMGTQHPVTTLKNGTGTCRDFALLMMEAARSLGFAARFVSGYLYDDSKIGGGRGNRDRRRRDPCLGADLFAGAGWVPFDPTNALVSDRNLIRVAVTRDPTQAVPLAGSFTGKPDDFLGMAVSVTVTADEIAAAGKDA